MVSTYIVRLTSNHLVNGPALTFSYFMKVRLFKCFHLTGLLLLPSTLLPCDTSANIACTGLLEMYADTSDSICVGKSLQNHLT